MLEISCESKQLLQSEEGLSSAKLVKLFIYLFIMIAACAAYSYNLLKCVRLLMIGRQPVIICACVGSTTRRE